MIVLRPAAPHSCAVPFSQTCGGPHLARNCPTAVAAARPAAGAGVVCHNCGGQNQCVEWVVLEETAVELTLRLHSYARDCKAPAAAVPVAGAGRGAPRPKTCYRCSLPVSVASVQSMQTGASA